MVHEHVVRRKSRLHGHLPHGVHLVVVGPAVVAAHQQLRRRAVLVQRDALGDAVRQHVTRTPVGMHPASEHQHAINVAEDGRLIGRHDARTRRRLHMGVYREDRHRAENGEHQNSQPDSLKPRVHVSPSFAIWDEYTASVRQEESS